MREAFSPGRLVVVDRLISPRGRLLNGKYGVIRDKAAPLGRIAVEIIGSCEGDRWIIPPYEPPKAFRATNLNIMDDETANSQGYHILKRYLGRKHFDLHMREGPSTRVLQNMRELFAVPRYTPDLNLRATMVNLLREFGDIGDVEEAIEMAQGCVADVEESDPNRGVMHYDLAGCLLKANRLEEALEAALKIEGEAYCIKIKGEMLQMIQKRCGAEDQWLPVKERTLRACVELEPNDGGTLHKLGAALCKMGRFDEGVRFLEQALATGMDNPQLRSDLENGRAGTYVEPAPSTGGPAFYVMDFMRGHIVGLPVGR